MCARWVRQGLLTQTVPTRLPGHRGKARLCGNVLLVALEILDSEGLDGKSLEQCVLLFSWKVGFRRG